jgi:hypothetical protein
MATIRSDQAKFQDQASITGNSKPNVSIPTEPGRHELIMGHEGESIRSMLGYRPTAGLISLFARIGIRHSNPKRPSLSPQHSRRSYADPVRSNMEQGGAPVNNGRTGYCSRGFQPGQSRGAGQA